MILRPFRRPYKLAEKMKNEAVLRYLAAFTGIISHCLLLPLSLSLLRCLFPFFLLALIHYPPLLLLLFLSDASLQVLCLHARNAELHTGLQRAVTASLHPPFACVSYTSPVDGACVQQFILVPYQWLCFASPFASAFVVLS